MKHTFEKLKEVTVSGEVVVKLNLRCYHVKVVDLLEWTPPQKKTSSERREKVEGVEEGVLSLWLACILVSHTQLLFR